MAFIKQAKEKLNIKWDGERLKTDNNSIYDKEPILSNSNNRPADDKFYIGFAEEPSHNNNKFNKSYHQANPNNNVNLSKLPNKIFIDKK